MAGDAEATSLSLDCGHSLAAMTVGGGRDAEDTFPTPYLANTPADVRQLAAQTGFRVELIDLIEGRPDYLRFSAVTYLGGWLYERLVNTIP